MTFLLYVPAYAIAALLSWLLWSHGWEIALGIGLGVGFVVFIVTGLLAERMELL